MAQSGPERPSNQPPTLRCRQCQEAGCVVIDATDAEALAFVCRACGARWSHVAARSCKPVPK